VALDDDVPEIDADAILNASVLGRSGISLRDGRLYFDGAPYRPDDTWEFGDHAVAHQLEDAALVLGDLGPDDLVLQPLQGGERAFVVDPHQAGVADDIGGEDSGEPAFHLPLSKKPCPTRVVKFLTLRQRGSEADSALTASWRTADDGRHVHS